MIEQHSPYIEVQWIVSNNHKTFVVNSNQGKINQGLAVHQLSISSRKKKVKLKGTAIWYFYTDNISSFSCCSRSTLEITPNKCSPRLVIHIKLNEKNLEIDSLLTMLLITHYLVWKIFRQINSIIISLVKTLLSRKFCQKLATLSRIIAFFGSLKKFRETNFFNFNETCCKLISRKKQVRR